MTAYLPKEASAPIGAALAILAHADPRLPPATHLAIDAALRGDPAAADLDMIAVTETYLRFARLAQGDPERMRERALLEVKKLRGIEDRREAMGLLVEVFPSGENVKRQEAMRAIARAWMIETGGG